eukprot:GHVP01050998.1.p2 GENE.GHVP01050998.1~~GHVP01050998.1.p2  ORF type:complete len:117 (-),score=13.84 GHVP01050998.1:203-553(-)
MEDRQQRIDLCLRNMTVRRKSSFVILASYSRSAGSYLLGCSFLCSSLGSINPSAVTNRFQIQSIDIKSWKVAFRRSMAVEVDFDKLRAGAEGIVDELLESFLSLLPVLFRIPCADY